MALGDLEWYDKHVENEVPNSLRPTHNPSVAGSIPTGPTDWP